MFGKKKDGGQCSACENSNKGGVRCRVCRTVRRVVVGVIVVVAVLLVCLQLFLTHMTPVVKSAMEYYGPKVTGAPLTLEKVSFSLIAMRFEMTGLVLGNPEGYKTPSAVEVGRVYVKVKPLSLFTDTIRVQQILVEDPAITYEVGLGNSNIGTILENVDKFSGASEEEPEAEEAEPEVEETAEESEGGKKVVIDEVKVSGGRIRLSAKVLMGVAAPIPLPTVTLHDIGKSDEGEDEGVSMIQATSDVLKGVFSSVVDVAKKGLSALGDGAKAVGGAIGDGAKAVGGAIGDGAKAASEAIGEGAKKLKNLFK